MAARVLHKAAVMRFGGLVLVTLVTACGAGGMEPAGSDGKADQVSDGEACFREYSSWLLNDVRPVLLKDPVDATLFRTVAAQMPCDDWEAMAATPAFFTWQGLVAVTVLAPYHKTIGEAWAEYVRGGSHSRFIDAARLDDG